MADDLAIILDRPMVGIGVMSVHQPIVEQGQVIADVTRIHADEVNTFDPAVAGIAARSSKAVGVTVENDRRRMFIAKLVFHRKLLRFGADANIGRSDTIGGCDLPGGVKENLRDRQFDLVSIIEFPGQMG
jgi:hypothetical protein